MLFIQPLWRWDTVGRDLQPQLGHQNITFTWMGSVIHIILGFGLTYHSFYNNVRVHSYAHPKHMMVLKHFAYIQYGDGMQSAGIHSLNNDTTTSHAGLSHFPNFLCLVPTFNRC